MNINAKQQKNLLLLVLLLLSSFAIVLTVTNHPFQNNKTVTGSTNQSSENLALGERTNHYNPNTPIGNFLQSNSNLFFEKNIGQYDNIGIVYSFKTTGVQINFLSSEIQFNQKASNGGDLITYSISFQGSNTVLPIASQELTNKLNYFIGKEHFTNVPLFKNIYYYNIYNKIDLRYYFINGQLKYEFIAHPGSNPSQIKLLSSDNTIFSLQGPNLAINTKSTFENLLKDNNLMVYQQKNSYLNQISASVQVNSKGSNVASFHIGSYDMTHDLIIDPVLVVNTGTYLGGNSEDSAVDVVLDAQKNIYIAGTTNSTDFPVVNALNSTKHQDIDIFITKLNSTGNGILWTTYFGGNKLDYVNQMSLDSNNNVVIVGYSNSTDLPLFHSQNSMLNGSNDALIASS